MRDHGMLALARTPASSPASATPHSARSVSPRALPTGLRTLLDRPIAYHRALVPLAESAVAALMLSQAIYWQLRTTSNDRWWWKTRQEWTEETGLTRSEQETARRSLRRHKWWAEKRRGVPARMYYRVDLDLLLAQLAGNQPTGQSNPSHHDGGTSACQPGATPPANTETTRDFSETTTTGGSGQLLLPQLTPATRSLCEHELIHCPHEFRSGVVRELSHRLAHTHDPLRFPHLWVRALVRAATAGTLARSAPSATLSAEQRTAIEADYQRRLRESRESARRQLGIKGRMG